MAREQVRQTVARRASSPSRSEWVLEAEAGKGSFFFPKKAAAGIGLVVARGLGGRSELPVPVTGWLFPDGFFVIQIIHFIHFLG